MAGLQPCKKMLFAQSMQQFQRAAISAAASCNSLNNGHAAARLFPRAGPFLQQARGAQHQPDRPDRRITGPKHQPTLASALRNMRGRELIRIVDTAAVNLRTLKEFQIVLKALAIDGQWRRAIRLLREMKEAGIEPDLGVYNEILSAMMKDKQVDKALETLETMRQQNIEPDVESYAHCIGACKPEEWQRALEILASMAEAKLEPNGRCFERAAAACEEGGQWQKSLDLFSELNEKGLESTSVGHNYALSACRQGKQWKRGFEIMAEMAKRQFEPDFRLRQDLEAQSRGLDRAPPPEPSQRGTPSPDNIWQRKQQLRDLREQDKRRQEERRLEQERLEREPAPEPYKEEGFMVYGGRDAFANRNAHTMPALDLDACRKICQERGYGGFTVWNNQAYFRSESPQQIRDSFKRAAGTTLYVNLDSEPSRQAKLKAHEEEQRKEEAQRRLKEREERRRLREAEGDVDIPMPSPGPRKAEAMWETAPRTVASQPQSRHSGRARPKLRSPGSYVLPVFAQHDRSNHAERQALIKVITRVQEASQAQSDAEFERECAEVTGTVRLYASHTPCISCMACFCQFQRLFPKVKLCVDFDDWRDTRRMVELARREEEYKRRGMEPPNYDCPGLSDMSDEEDFIDDDSSSTVSAAAAAA